MIEFDITHDGQSHRRFTVATALAANIPAEAVIVGLRAEAKRLIVAAGETLALGLVTDYPSAEREGWTVKLSEAKALVAGGAEADAIALTLEAAITGETVADVAQAVLAKAALTGLIPAVIAGMRRKAFADIDAASTEAEIEAIFAATKATAEAAAEAIAAGDAAALEALWS